MDEIIRREIKAHHRAMSRIPSEGLNCMNINDYIASMTDMARSPLARPPHSNEGERLERVVGILAYLRDTYGAKTYGGAHKLLRDGKVNPKIVELWMEENMLRNELCDAVCDGYPQYANRAIELKDARINKIPNKE
ncbi:MAG: hypothetical protein COT55_02970 [Candidatus Diapherotrites archaeon CG09_land_8_20_14_0_10_32_12]|nr:MAG: hypothetical protein COT55_02970 [Candidatus Diapherotrites archaeon CG09_land_8_20_14_0_10_32_12]